MLITGDKRLSSIIATEFMRMYDHYKSRFYINEFKKQNKAIKKKNKERNAQGQAPKPLKTMDIHLTSDAIGAGPPLIRDHRVTSSAIGLSLRVADRGCPHHFQGECERIYTAEPAMAN